MSAVKLPRLRGPHPKPRPARLRAFGRLAALLVLLDLAVACQKGESANPGPEASPTAQQERPPFELKDSTTGVLLTWLDESGDFHVEESLAAVPEGRRNQVRVVQTERLEGTGDAVVVADLTQKDAEGRYALTMMPRSEWNKLGAERRKVRMDAVLDPSAAPTASLNAPLDPVVLQQVRAIIYGASWCKPCHDAESLLKKLGVNVTKKDIESSRAAQAEMQAKLAKAGQSGASIPVIDVAGELFVGFNPAVLKQAVKRAAKKLAP